FANPQRSKHRKAESTHFQALSAFWTGRARKSIALPVPQSNDPIIEPLHVPPRTSPMWLSPITIICLEGCIEVDNPLRIDEDLSDYVLIGLRKTQPLRGTREGCHYHERVRSLNTIALSWPSNEVQVGKFQK